MSLAGIAIAIGTMVDMGIIISENIFRGIAEWENEGRPDGEAGRLRRISEMTGEVAPAVVTAVSTTVISFLPVFFLTGRDYRLFAPLAWTKTFSLVASLIVAVLLVPPLARLFLKNPVGKSWRSVIGASFAGATAAGLCAFVWGDQIESLALWDLEANRVWHRCVCCFISGQPDCGRGSLLDDPRAIAPCGREPYRPNRQFLLRTDTTIIAAIQANVSGGAVFDFFLRTGRLGWIAKDSQPSGSAGSRLPRCRL